MNAARVKIWLLLTIACFLQGFRMQAMADEQDSPAEIESETQELDVHIPGGIRTLGGRQFWGDVEHFHGWRIQQNVLSGAYRLLDAGDSRHATGSLQECRAKLDSVREQKQLPAMTGKAVILIHGIGRSSKCFHGMAKALKADGYATVCFDYPSTRIPIQKSVDYLHSVIQSLPQVESIDLVCHSMGGLLLRSYLAQHNEPRFHRAVLLGVPNKGAEMADLLKNNPLFKFILGPAGQQLVTDKDGMIDQLPAPGFEFGVLAGGRSGAKGYNPILPGDNDSTVTVASTRLEGAADFLLLPVIHSLLMTNAEAIKATQHFLNHGQFADGRPPQPISRDDITIIQ